MSSSYCGIDCTACTWRESNGCKTCRPNSGRMFWGSCGVAACCIGKGLEDCAQCGEYPCAMLKEFALDKEHGDQGERLANLCREHGLEQPACGLCCGAKCVKADG